MFTLLLIASAAVTADMKAATLAPATGSSSATTDTAAQARQQSDAEQEIIRLYSATQGRWLALYQDRDRPDAYRQTVLEWIERNATALHMDADILRQSFLTHADKLYTDDEIKRLEPGCHEYDDLFIQIAKNRQAAMDADYIRRHTTEPGIQILPNGILYKTTQSKNGENQPVEKTRIIEASTTSGYVMETMYVSPVERLSQSLREVLPLLPPAQEWQIIVPVDLLDNDIRRRMENTATIVVYTLKIHGTTPNDHLKTEK